ncbi:hypothetical protein [Bacillus sp. FJAT-44742]|uniref:hypothetical protein n=1 Tax=Bacillus sp. FJAT-44742 TaxID=2014005 RepID=UPI0018E262A2|nr:hypothetical protein [Bacillus sp. FJAT-44742]
MKAELEEFNVQVATINPGPFETGFNDRMFEEKWKWYDQNEGFTSRDSIAETEKVLEEQYDPEDMIAKMVEVIEADSHHFRTAFPQETENNMKSFEQETWEEKV